jgi:trigger factor
MKVTQEKLPDCQVGLEIEVTGDMTQKTYDQVVNKYLKTANIPGFRKGKVPRPILIQQLGATRIKAAALEELMQDSIDDAIKQESIEAIGNYQLISSFEELIVQYIPGQPITISASVDVPPRVTLSTYKGLAVKAEEVHYKPERLTDTLERYRQSKATLIPVEDRPAQDNDSVTIDFVGKLTSEGQEPEAFEGGSAEDFQVEIKEGRFIPGFVEGIVGMKVGETKDVDIVFPDTYGEDELAGKPVTFTITLKEIKERELPELDDEFAQDVSEFDTLEELEASLVERFTKEAEDATTANKHQALLDELVKYLEAELPKTLVNREADYMVTQTVMQLANQGIDVNKFLTKDLVANLRDNARPEAIERLHRTLALGEIAKQESITVDEGEIEAKVEEMMDEVEDPEKIDIDRLYEVVQEDLLKEKILTWLVDASTVELVPEGTLTPAEPEADAGDMTVDIKAEAEPVEAEAETETEAE